MLDLRVEPGEQVGLGAQPGQALDLVGVDRHQQVARVGKWR
ncbi:hypothetical protein [Dactylosporangium sp. NPDC049140]